MSAVTSVALTDQLPPSAAAPARPSQNPHHAIAQLEDAESGAAVKVPGQLRSGMRLKVVYREAHGNPQNMRAMLGMRPGGGW